LPMEARGVVAGLQQQLQQLGQQHQQALALLGNKEAEHDIKRDKQEKDYDAKMTGHMVEMQKHFSGLIDGHMQRFGEHVAKLEQSVQQGKINQETQAQKQTAERQPAMRNEDRESIKEMAKHVGKLAEAIHKPRRRRIRRDKEGNAIEAIDEIM